MTGEMNALFIQGSSFLLIDKYLFWVLNKLCAIISATFHNNPMYRYYNYVLTNKETEEWITQLASEVKTKIQESTPETTLIIAMCMHMCMFCPSNE